ncbi:hypothetical protein [Natronobiforma cellulositropha]|uniref:hypothetical protein n=1 Tax=Natronobiforma cellulositropha TaxID=1679076 RepID=UPI0021D5DD0C|nr:hypothetical protein [Natronobiforma cellulositropha]
MSRRFSSTHATVPEVFGFGAIEPVGTLALIALGLALIALGCWRVYLFRRLRAA